MPTVDWFSQAVFTWVAQNATVFLPQAMRLYQILAVAYVAWFGLVFAFDSLSHRRAGAAQSGLRVLVELVLVGFSLRYYAVPTSVLGGLSVHQLMPTIGTYLATILNTTALTNCTHQLDLLIGAQAPPTWHSPWMQIICYALLAGLVWLLQGLMFMLTIVGNVFIGAGIVFGPLLMVCFLIPIDWVKALTPGWFRYMFSWSMFQVVAAAIVSIWSGMMLFVLNASFHGVYTGIELIFALKLVIICTIAFAFCALRVERVANALFGGLSGAEGFGHFIKGSFL